MSFVIAEVGSNFSDLKDCLDSIEMAASLGANAAKFQLFSHKDMFGYGDTMHNFYASWLPEMRMRADACGVELMCTAFSEEGLNLVDPFVSRHKIASSDISYVPLLRAVKATNKPILLSTGASSEADIALAVGELSGADLTLLYCVSAYPAENINLFGIEKLQRLFEASPIKFGYSCHSTGYMECVYAVKKFGASVVEKHFKLRDDMVTPDSPHSLNPQDFKKMVKLIREGSHPAMPRHDEEAMLTKHKRRLMTTKEIKAGEAFIYGKNFGIFRSKLEDLKGLSGFAYEAIAKRVASRDLGAHSPIGPRDFA